MDINDNIKEQAAQFLPDALGKAVEAYKKFSDQAKCDQKSKEFENHYKACKAAMAHIELLIKLAEKCGLPDANAPNYVGQIQLKELIEQAHRDVLDDREKNKLE